MKQIGSWPLLNQVKVLAARKAYEFRLDDLRLTTLCAQPVTELVREMFQFQSTALGSPLPTFGDVPGTYPPGYVFDMGVTATPEGQLVPIRFIHFEPTRIVFDIAGPSAVIDLIYSQLRHALEPITAVDGSPIIGEPETILDYSEVTAEWPTSLDSLFGPRVRKLFAQTESGRKPSKEVVIPTISLVTQSATEKWVNAQGPSVDSRSYRFTMRAGTHPSENKCWSSAPLDSDAHIAYLTQLADAVAS